MEDPYYFPFEIVDGSDLIPNNEYYIKLNDNVIHDFLKKRRKLPVTRIKATFTGLFTKEHSTYAVFKNIKIINKNRKPGSCFHMLVRDNDELVAPNSCDVFNHICRCKGNCTCIEVFLNIKVWTFGIPTELNLVTKQTMRDVFGKKTNQDVTSHIISEFIYGKNNKLASNKSASKKSPSKKSRSKTHSKSRSKTHSKSRSKTYRN
jgi:hypothetical protein